MIAEIRNPWPEYISVACSSQEVVGELSERFSIYEILFQPEWSKLPNRMENFLLQLQLFYEDFHGNVISPYTSDRYFLVFLNEGNHGLPEIFRDVLRVICGRSFQEFAIYAFLCYIFPLIVNHKFSFLWAILLKFLRPLFKEFWIAWNSQTIFTIALEVTVLF